MMFAIVEVVKKNSRMESAHTSQRGNIASVNVKVVHVCYPLLSSLSQCQLFRRGALHLVVTA